MTATSASKGVLSAALLVLAVYWVNVVGYIDYVNDDAYITFRYSANLASGVGPYFNPGEHVEGYTNLSLMLAMAGAYAVAGGAAVPVAAKALGVLAAALALVSCLGIARRLAPAVRFSDRESLVWGGLAAGLVALSPGFVVNSVSGLETALLAACLAAAVWCDSGSRPNRYGTAVWLSLAVLTRPEGVLVAATYLGLLLLLGWWRDRAGASASSTSPAAFSTGGVVPVALTVAGVFIARLVFRYLTYDGELLPNTFYAKAGGFWGTGAWEYVHAGALVPLLGIAGAALAALGWLAPGRPRRVVVPLAATAVVGASLPFVVGTDWMVGWRFSAPYLPLLALTFTFGWVRLTGLGDRRRELLVLGLLITLPIAWVTQREVRRNLGEYVTVKARGYRNGHAALAQWLLDGRANPGDQIALMDIGIISYRCIDQRILDITGLTDREIARSPGEFLKKEYDPAYVLDQEPEFIVLAYVVGGDPDRPPAPGAPIYPWSPIEARLAAEPVFERLYRRSSELPPAGADERQHLAWRLGAEQVFLHDDPEIHYALAVYRHQSAS